MVFTLLNMFWRGMTWVRLRKIRITYVCLVEDYASSDGSTNENIKNVKSSGQIIPLFQNNSFFKRKTKTESDFASCDSPAGDIGSNNLSSSQRMNGLGNKPHSIKVGGKTLGKINAGSNSGTAKAKLGSSVIDAELSNDCSSNTCKAGGNIKIKGAGLGSGDIGTVYLAELVGTHCPFALKVLNNEFLARRDKLSRAQTERETLQMLDHPFLPTLYAHFTTDKLSCLVMEYCPGGDLHVIRQKQPSRCFSEQAARFYVAEVLALEYLHMLGIV